jgi:hypothetical protein
MKPGLVISYGDFGIGDQGWMDWDALSGMNEWGSLNMLDNAKNESTTVV